MNEIERIAKAIITALNPDRKSSSEFYLNSLSFLFRRCDETERDFFLCHLFMMNWIDQTLFWVLSDNKNPGCLNEERLYDFIKEKFRLIKIKWDWNGGPVCPSIFLNLYDRVNLLSKKVLLYKAKKFWWSDNIKQYLISLNRTDLINLVENEMLKDLELRHRFKEKEETALKYLWANKGYLRIATG